MNTNKLGEISDGLKQSVTEQSKLAHEIVDLLKQLVQPQALNENEKVNCSHACTSNCRRNGCPCDEHDHN